MIYICIKSYLRFKKVELRIILNSNTIKFFYPEASGVIKGFNIFAEAIPEGSLGCGINIVTTNTNTYKSDFYLEVRALNDEGEKIDMTSFFIQNIKPMERIETLSHFKKLKFCAEINNLELFVK